MHREKPSYISLTLIGRSLSAFEPPPGHAAMVSCGWGAEICGVTQVAIIGQVEDMALFVASVLKYNILSQRGLHFGLRHFGLDA